MADNPFDQFDAPKANPFDQFDKPATTTTKTAPSTPWLIATDANHPSKVGEWLKTAIDSGTFGLADYAQAGLNKLGVGDTDKSIAQLHQDSAAARKDIGPIASATADLAGYAVGPGKFAAGGKLAGKLGGGLLARIAGGAAEGSGSAVLGTVGHGDTDVGDNLKALALGGAIGAGTGVLPGGRGPKPVTPATAELKAVKDAAFAPLKTTPVNASSVDAAVSSVNPSSGARVNLSDTFKGKIADIEKEVSGTTSGLTADDVANYQRALWGKTRNGFDQAAAGDYERALNNAVGPSTAYDITAANKAHNVFKTSGEIDNWRTNPASAPGAIASRLAKRPALYQAQPGLFDALSAVGKKGGEPSLLAKLRDYGIRGAVGGGLGYGAGYVMGGNPGQTAVEGALGGVIAPHVIKAAGSLPIRNSLLAAQHLNATGVPVSPGVYTPQWLQIPGMLARQTGYGLGAAGAL